MGIIECLEKESNLDWGIINNLLEVISKLRPNNGEKWGTIKFMLCKGNGMCEADWKRENMGKRFARGRSWKE